jgi:glycosyltransferase involved in cell wall biosynthesis
MLLKGILPDPVFTAAFFLHGLLWGLYAVMIARRMQADIYFTRDVGIGFWLTRFGLPTIYDSHGIHRRAGRYLLRLIASSKSLHLAVVVTQAMHEYFLEIGFPCERLILVPNGVDVKMFLKAPSRDACRRQFGLPMDRPIIGYIGRFRAMGMEKGIPELIKAISKLQSDDECAPLLLCVGGPKEAIPDYLELAKKVGLTEKSLIIRDRVPHHEIPKWIRACDVVTIPWPWTEFSAYYTSPLKMFEYMAAGTPVVASDLPSIREILVHGENAWLVAPGDPDALTDGIRTLLEDRPLASRLLTQALLDVKPHTWDHRASRILQAAGFPV